MWFFLPYRVSPPNQSVELVEDKYCLITFTLEVNDHYLYRGSQTTIIMYEPQFLPTCQAPPAFCQVPQLAVQSHSKVQWEAMVNYLG